MRITATRTVLLENPNKQDQGKIVDNKHGLEWKWIRTYKLEQRYKLILKAKISKKDLMRVHESFQDSDENILMIINYLK
jgi:hypothetical protein